MDSALAKLRKLAFGSQVPAFQTERAVTVFRVDRVFLASVGFAVAFDAGLPSAGILAGIDSFVFVLVSGGHKKEANKALQRMRLVVLGESCVSGCAGARAFV